MKILVTSNLTEEILAPLRSAHEVVVNRNDFPLPRSEIIEKIRDKDGLLCSIVDRIDEELMSNAPNLKMIANIGVGYDNIKVPAASAREIKVSNTPGVLTDATADLAFALILSVARRLVEGDGRTRANKWGPWAPFVFLGTQVTGKTLGIIGLGQIGKAVASRAKGFRMPILYHNRNRIPENEELELGAKYVDLETLLRESDFVSLHVSLNDQSRSLIGTNEFELMKSSAFIINVARGPVIDENALVKALKEKKIAGAGLDVYEKEPQLAPGLAQLENTVLSPHMGSATVETRIAMAQLAVENLLAGLSGQRPPNCLNC
ncbi:MAG: D-glycerate dehydrogenase [Deltaproteobacteria bacterium]|nr:D-glycerate dehydrogenase [Deltaproteobacteria bacterium]